MWPHRFCVERIPLYNAICFWISYCEHHLCATYRLGCTLTQNKDGIAYTVHPIAKPKVQNKHSISLELKLLIIPNYHFENNWRIHTYLYTVLRSFFAQGVTYYLTCYAPMSQKVPSLGFISSPFGSFDVCLFVFFWKSYLFHINHTSSRGKNWTC